jgi:iron complex outermembrane receptor protein
LTKLHWRAAALLLGLPVAAHAAETGGATASPGTDAPPAATESLPENITVTARRREEDVQSVPVAVSVIGAQQIEATGDYNLGQLSQLTPSVQFISSNPRNTAITIRGLGTSFGLTNDGLESGVGLYVDQVYIGRPATATFDFIDIDQVEVLRGPQGTLFGKNTTAGAINITTREPTFVTRIETEASSGNYDLLQGKASISGPLVGDILAGQLSIERTSRSGTAYDVATGKDLNNQNDFGTRGQLLYRAALDLRIRLIADYNQQQTECCALSYVGYGTTLKSANRQYPALAAAFNYSPASLDPFARLVDENSPTRANQTTGGAAAIADWDFGSATLTSVSAWRYWNWNPASDRDFTRLSIQTVSANADRQNQYSQEVRISSNGKQTVDYIAGIYAFRQVIDGTPLAQYGADATNWLLAGSGSPANLLDGYTASGKAHSTTDSYAVFAQVVWNIMSRLHFTPGLRYTYEDKSGSFSQFVSGGHPRTDSAADNAADVKNLNSIASNQAYAAHFTDGSPSGQVNLAYDVAPDMMAYANYARGHKSGGINLAGIPLDSNGNPVVSTAVIKPEDIATYEIGLKTQFFQRRLTVNVDAFDTIDRDYQVNVVDSGPGALRGYLSNIPKVDSRGFEWDTAFSPIEDFSGYLSGAWTDGTYASFPNGPCPLERIGNSTSACNLSGKALPGVSRWSVSAGGEYRYPVPVVDGTGYFGLDASYRSKSWSDVSDSNYLLIKGYTAVNARVGLVRGPLEMFLWVKNLLDAHYFQYLQAQTGNSGMIVGLLGDPRTYGITLRVTY